MTYSPNRLETKKSNAIKVETQLVQMYKKKQKTKNITSKM